MLIEATSTVDADAIHIDPVQFRATDAGERTGTAMLAALARILRHGTFSAEEVAILSAVVDDDSVDFGTRCLARQSIEWLTTVDLNRAVASSVIKR